MNISDSVGVKGKNLRGDIALVQMLLNRAIRVPLKLLKVDSSMGPLTIHTIKRFQKDIVGFKNPDGRIDPNGKTWTCLSRYADEPAVLFKDGFMLHMFNRQFGEHSRKQVAVRGVTKAVLAEVDPNKKIAWGAKVTSGFKVKIQSISKKLEISPDFLMACMAFETGESFSPSIKNAAGSGATGLIQFMPSTAKSLGTSTEDLAKMSAVSQLDYVEKYFKPYKGRLKTLEDVYLAILYPAAIGKPVDEALFNKGKKVYEQNSGFDKNKDGIITPAEISTKVRAKYNRGLQKGFFG